MLRRAHYNAFCGNLAVLTLYLKSLGRLSSSGTERSLHTRCGAEPSAAAHISPGLTRGMCRRLDGGAGRCCGGTDRKLNEETSSRMQGGEAGVGFSHCNGLYYKSDTGNSVEKSDQRASETPH